MAAQLTLQAPLALPPAEVESTLNRLWSQELEGSSGASTFTLVIYEASWLQQQLIRTGRLDGPITGLLDKDLIERAKQAVRLREGILAKISPPNSAWRRICVTSSGVRGPLLRRMLSGIPILPMSCRGAPMRSHSISSG